ncbi:MAG: hypothetical protein HYY37_05560 [Candidatus Aenigmarchaeota archaeon]|nr:hypothetical protein [Candidatus Aenigmarchaeota archaeon]
MPTITRGPHRTIKAFLIVFLLYRLGKRFAQRDLSSIVRKKWNLRNNRSIKRHLGDLVNKRFLLVNQETEQYWLPKKILTVDYARQLLHYFEETRTNNPEPFRGLIPGKPNAYFNWDGPLDGTSADQYGLIRDALWNNFPQSIRDKIRKQRLTEFERIEEKFNKEREIATAIWLIQESIIRSHARNSPIPKLTKKDLCQNYQLLEMLKKRKMIRRDLKPLVEYLLLELRIMITKKYWP